MVIALHDRQQSDPIRWDQVTSFEGVDQLDVAG